MSSQRISLDWNAVLDAIAAEVSQQSFNTWFKNTEFVSFDPEAPRLIVGVGSVFHKSWIASNYSDLIATVVERLCGLCPAIEITIAPEPFRKKRAAQRREGVHEKVLPVAPRPKRHTLLERLHQEYRLESFIPGPGNQMAHAACRRAALHPGEFNPIFIFGDHGLGKTHLLHGMCAEAVGRDGEHRIELLSGEEFVQQYTQAHAGKRLPAFRQRMRTCDFLVLDDIQILARGNKAATHEELLNTVDALMQRGSQIALVSNCRPEELKLPPRLLSRITAGLSLRVEQPDPETRKAIVRQKVGRREIALPDEVVELVARCFQGSVRDLEGAIGKLAAHANLGGLEIGLKTAAAIIGPTMPRRTTAIDLDAIAEATAKAYGVTVAELKSRKRSNGIALARKAGIHIARRITPLSLSEIGAYFGGRSHATIIANLKKPILPNFDKDVHERRLRQILHQLGADHIEPAEIFREQGRLFES